MVSRIFKDHQRFCSNTLPKSLKILEDPCQYLYKIFSGFKGKSLNVTETSVILGKVLGQFHPTMCSVVSIKMEKKKTSHSVLNRQAIKVQNMSNYYLLLLNCKMCFQEFELQLSDIHSSWIICSTGYSTSSVSRTLMRHS